MKNLFLLPLMVVALLVSCNNEKKAKTVTELFKVAEGLVGQEVTVQGEVSHICSHSGRKCFLKDEEGNTLKINAGDIIKTFPKDIMGKNITAKGILKMSKIDKAMIDEMAKEEDHCDTESSNVTKMREWMKKNNKDYYAFYYIDGKEYKEIK